jgi:predicted glutamine amidotransferase
MCRLFGLTSAPHRVHARFWLLEAPDSLTEQSKRNADGTGLGFFEPDGRPVLDKEPVAAYQDGAFSREVGHTSSETFVAHVRLASTGGLEAKNTHPFEMKGRILAHNGAVSGLERLEEQLGSYRELVLGDTDSERMFALITKHTDANGGDVGAGIREAAAWIAANIPVYSINLILATADELWAFRYPETHRLFVLRRQAGGTHGDRALHAGTNTLRVHSQHLARHPSVVVASEPLDEHPDWRLLDVGELLHVNGNLAVTSSIVIDDPPAELMEVKYLHPSKGAAA